MRRYDRLVLQLLLLCCAVMVLCTIQWTLPSVNEDREMADLRDYEKWRKEQLAYIDKNNLKLVVRDIMKEMGYVNQSDKVLANMDQSKLNRVQPLDEYIKDLKNIRGIGEDNHDNVQNLVKERVSLDNHDVQFPKENNPHDEVVKMQESGYEKKDTVEKVNENKDSLSKNEKTKVDKLVIQETFEQVAKVDVNEGHFPEQIVPDVKVQPEVTYPPFVEDIQENGPGDMGRGFDVAHLNASEKAEMDRMEKIHHFNLYASDRISVHRRIPDLRPQACRDIKYRSDLPMASVIICFYNEAWSVLLRTVHSVLDRSPPHLLREVILVDDFSTNDYLQVPLETYMSKFSQVKIVRSPERGGLIRARLLGYSHAMGPVLVYLDSHVECYPGWLEPLLERIAESPTNVPFPQVPFIMKEDFGLGGVEFNNVGAFHWAQLEFTWIPMPESEQQRRTSPADPARSGTMPGGLFAIDKEFFTHLGTYDPDLMFWGGENMELSFKDVDVPYWDIYAEIWMCNGMIEHHPCSQVGHVYRDASPITWNSNVIKTIRKNTMRVAEVWMDDYKELFYDASHPKSDFGDITERQKLRESLKCHDFRWYLDHVYHLAVPPRALAKGQIKGKHMCLDGSVRTLAVALYRCNGGGNQWWMMHEGGFLMRDTYFLCYENERLFLYWECKDKSRPYWIYNPQTQILQHGPSGLCLQMTIEFKLIMSPCRDTEWQRWAFPAT